MKCECKNCCLLLHQTKCLFACVCLCSCDRMLELDKEKRKDDWTKKKHTHCVDVSLSFFLLRRAILLCMRFELFLLPFIYSACDCRRNTERNENEETILLSTRIFFSFFFHFTEKFGSCYTLIFSICYIWLLWLAFDFCFRSMLQLNFNMEYRCTQRWRTWWNYKLNAYKLFSFRTYSDLWQMKWSNNSRSHF